MNHERPNLESLLREQHQGAVFSDDRLYRHWLWRRWRSCEPSEMVAFCGLNPLKADETDNDNTVKKWNHRHGRRFKANN